MSRITLFSGRNRSGPSTLPIVIYTGQAAASPLSDPRIVLSEVRIIGMMVQGRPLFTADTRA